MDATPEICYDELPLIYRQHDGTVYERTGYCCQCGQCCIGCPMLIWLVEHERGICGNRIRQEPFACGQDIRIWPDRPQVVENCDKCTYKFTLVSTPYA